MPNWTSEGSPSASFPDATVSTCGVERSRLPRLPGDGLAPGMNAIDVEYKFADGHWARQIQKIRVH